ncbi:MAG TPA: ABC transporter permease [Stellaceae bacterium]|nr:ABC transporter permease [Stellaceae bacterium]
MFRNCLAAAWRNAARDRLHSLINVLGLALGFAVAIAIGLYLRDELTYDRFLPDHDRVYRLTEQLDIPGRGLIVIPGLDAPFAQYLAADVPEIEAIARMRHEILGIRHGAIEETDKIYDADPNFLTIVRLPLVAGDAATALQAPDAVVLTETAAHKWLGDKPVLGQVLEIAHHPMRVTAILADLPGNTHLDIKILVSAKAPFSDIARNDKEPKMFQGPYATYVRLKPGAAPAEVAARLPGFVQDRFIPLALQTGAIDKPEDADIVRPAIEIQNIADIHLFNHSAFEEKPRGDPQMLWALGIVGLLVLAVAGVNFVTLLTARAGRRAVEIGVRKVAGAARSQLVLQFIAETIAAAGIAMIFAVAAVELALPKLNGFLDKTMRFAYWQEPATAAALLALGLGVGIAAGLYPALVLSGLRPVDVLKTRGVPVGGGRLRRVLVVLQFAVSIGLIIATLVIHRQTEFALRQSLDLGTDPILVVSNLGAPFPRTTLETLRDRLAALPGVRLVAASFSVPTDYSTSIDTVELPEHPSTTIRTLSMVGADPDFFPLYGLKAVAGRLISRDRPGDAAAKAPAVMLNEAAVRSLGLGSPAAAVGQHIRLEKLDASEIIGIVPDMPLKSVREAAEPTAFFISPDAYGNVSVKIAADRVADTVAAIDRTWAELVPDRPIRRAFLDERIERLYLEITRQGEIFAGFAAITVVIACLGLFGLSAFTAERRTKEIGIRKALGASTVDVAGLLIWQFALPVLLATLLAWPVAWVVMRRWLDGFAGRVDLDPLLFVAAAGAALAIAIGTTATHAVQVARSHPALALRYE